MQSADVLWPRLSHSINLESSILSCVTALQIRAVIPRRSTLAGDRGVLIVNYAMHKQKTLFFFLLQVRTPHQQSCTQSQPVRLRDRDAAYDCLMLMRSGC